MKVRWDKGGDAEIASITMDKIALVSSTPSPPGSRIEGALDLAPNGGEGEGEGAPRLRVKVHGCKRDADGRFRIDGRPLDLTRALLDRLAPQS
jgi:hypothetical protein